MENTISICAAIGLSHVIREVEENRQNARKIYFGWTSNETNFERMYDEAVPLLPALEGAMAANRTVQELVVSGSMVVRRDDSARKLFAGILRALAKLPELVRVRLEAASEGTFTDFMAPAMATFLRLFRNLQSIAMNNIETGGSPRARRAAASWGQAILDWHYNSFVEFQWGSRPANLNVLDPLLQALSRLPGLSKLVVDNAYPRQHGGCSKALRRLLSRGAPAFAHLALRCRKFPLPAWSSLAASNRCLQTLDVAGAGSDERAEYPHVATILRNIPTLTTLRLEFTGTGVAQRDDISTDNNDIKLDGTDDKTALGLVSIARTLRDENLTLQDFVVRDSSLHTSDGANYLVVKKAFADALEVNCSLQKLRVTGCSSSYPSIHHQQERINFYTYLNRQGRGELLSLVCNTAMSSSRRRKAVLDVLISSIGSRFHLDCIFYYLSANPSILGEISNGPFESKQL